MAGGGESNGGSAAGSGNGGKTAAGDGGKAAAGDGGKAAAGDGGKAAAGDGGKAAAGDGGKAGGNAGAAGNGGASELSAACAMYCECHMTNCPDQAIPGGASCGDFCQAMTMDQLACRQNMCGLVPAQPNNDHCKHSVGIDQCL
jgi:hypothetical protein